MKVFLDFFKPKYMWEFASITLRISFCFVPLPILTDVMLYVPKALSGAGVLDLPYAGQQSLLKIFIARQQTFFVGVKEDKELPLVSIAPIRAYTN
jgi:hypothetical protein